MKHEHDVVESWINLVFEEGQGLTKWEKDFIESIAEQFDVTEEISDRQEEILERIYANKTP
jgi:hypothetical protein